MLLHKIQFRRLFYSVLTLSLALQLGACSSSPKILSKKDLNPVWIQDIYAYEQSLPNDHPDRVDNLLVLDSKIISDVTERFTHWNKHARARQLARWLISREGLGLSYNEDANLTPNQAYEQRRGNCLTFTLLLVSLAKHIDIELSYNEVDYPGMWNLDESAGIIFYRHINALLETRTHTQVFDLAIENYQEGFPQRVIDERAAGALLHNNLGVEALRKKDYELAHHYLKLGISTSPKNPDLWVNLGVLLKKQGDTERSETAFLKALEINHRHSIAASNLEHLYRASGQTELADDYKELVSLARLENPYFQYQRALDLVQEKKYRLAKRAVSRAIRLHKTEPMFFELRSIIKQNQEDYKGALKDLEKAHLLTSNQDQRGRYIGKAERIVNLLQEKQAQRARFGGQPL